jgi:uncharacterized protein (TIGR03437 family)
MSLLRAPLVFILCAAPCLSATFGTVINHTTALSDLALDEARKRLYVLDPFLSEVEVYSTASRTPAPSSFVNLDTNCAPPSMALSRPATAGGSPQFLYVACYATSSIEVIDLTTLRKTLSVTLPAAPQAIAVGADGRVLVSTNGTSAGQNILTIYDPSPSAATSLSSVLITPGAPSIPTVPPPNGVAFLASHARLQPTADGKTIIGVHEFANNSRTVFVYDVAAATVLRSRTVPAITPILAISPDGLRFLSGPFLFDTQSLAIVAQQSAVNSPFQFVANANFNVQTNQGGAVFTPDGSALIAAYNILPNLSPTPQSNTSQLLINTPDNLRIQLGVQLAQNLSGKMVITADGGTIYALSQSGFLVLPISTLGTSTAPIAVPDSNVALLASDQCGVTAGQNTAVIPVRNLTGSALNVTAQLLTTTATSTTVRTTPKSYGGDLTASFSAAATRTLGTSTPDQVLIQAAQAVNIVPTVRIFQNNRNAEAIGTIFPVDTGATNTGLTDMVADAGRQRLYLANPGMNRVEVFDMQQRKFTTAFNVGQLPRSLAFGTDTSTLYVANSGGESISVIDLNKGSVSSVQFPPLPFGSAFAVVTPQVIASSQNGPQVVMSDGTLWKVVGNSVVPRRPLNPAIFGTAISVPGPQTMASTQDGKFILLLSANGNGYLYSADADDFVRTANVLGTTITGYFGPIAAGPAGQYYLVDDRLLDSSLTLLAGGSAVGPTPGGLPVPTSTSRPVSAVAPVGALSYLRFTTPIRATPTATVTDAGLIELITADLTTGTLRTTASSPALEGPPVTAVGAGRAVTNGRTMALDPSATTAFVLTTSGLSVVPLAPSGVAPQTTNAGIVNIANFQSRIAPGGLIAIFGKNLAASATASAPLPSVLGGTCVTLNNAPIPLMASSAGQINAQVPFTLAAGNYPLVIRAVANQTASTSVNVAVSKYAPAVFVDSQGPAIFHHDGKRVTKDNPAVRDEQLTLYATGLGATTGGRVTTGQSSPASPLAVTSAVSLYFGDPTRSDTGVIVDWSGLAPGDIGVYQINCRVPGRHFSGDNLPVTLRVGGVSSPTTGPNVALVSVQ